MSVRRPARALLALAIAAAAAWAWGFSAPKPEDGPRGLRFSWGPEPESLDPAIVTALVDSRYLDALFEGLTHYDRETFQPAPGVAERWDVSPDGIVYTFHLRPAVWSDGTPLTARDFAWSWDRVRDPATGAKYAYMLDPMKSWRAVDDRTLEVTLHQPCPYFLDLTGFMTLLPVPRHVVERHGQDWIKPGILASNGPFVLEDWRPYHRIALRKNPRFWNADAVRLERAVSWITDNELTALNLYCAGELDWVTFLPQKVMEVLLDRPDFKTSPALGTLFVRFNAKKAPFDRPGTRKAFASAIDRERIARYVTKGGEVPTSRLVPPGVLDYPGVDGLAFDPAVAKAHLEEARQAGGWASGPVELLLPSNVTSIAVGEVLQRMWREHLGVEVRLKVQERKIYYDTMGRLEYDLALGGWYGDYLDPNTFLDCFLTDGGNNRTGWSNAEYDRLIAQAAREPSNAERWKLFQAAERMLLVDACAICPLYHYVNPFLARERVRGLRPNVRGQYPLRHLKLAD